MGRRGDLWNWLRWAAEHGFIGLASALLPGDEHNNAFLVKTVTPRFTEIHTFECSDRSLQPLWGTTTMTFSRFPLWVSASLAAGKDGFSEWVTSAGGNLESWQRTRTRDASPARQKRKAAGEGQLRFRGALTPDRKDPDVPAQTGPASKNDMASLPENWRQARSWPSPQTGARTNRKQVALINASGTEVVYTMSDARSSYDVYVVPAQGGQKRKDMRQLRPYRQSFPGWKALSRYATEWPTMTGVHLVDMASGKSALVLEHSRSIALYSHRASPPDGKWIVFLMARGVGAF